MMQQTMFAQRTEPSTSAKATVFEAVFGALITP
jgi:hypothetical protein